MGLNHSPLIATSGLLQYLDAGNTKSYPGSGTAWNDIIDGNNATLSTPIYSTVGNGSLLFNGTSDTANCGNLGTLPLQGTISLWFNASAMSNYGGLLCTNLNGLNSGIRIEVASSGNVQSYVGDGTNVSSALVLGTAIAGSWYKADLTWNTSSNTVVGYLNGVQGFSTSNTYWPTTMPSVTLGNAYSTLVGYRYFKGYISQLSVYNIRLTSEQVLINFNALRGRYGV